MSKWGQPDVPQTGWSCVGIEDLGKLGQTCEMCERQEIRYVHSMWHPEYPDTLECGCVRAGHMEQDLAAAKRREHDLKLRAARRERLASRRWSVSRSGNEYINLDGHNVVVYPQRTGWGFRLCATRYDGTRLVYSQQPYGTRDEAKRAALDALGGAG